ncbi:MAG: DUF6869 domain-containing protein [Devosia sp.]
MIATVCDHLLGATGDQSLMREQLLDADKQIAKLRVDDLVLGWRCVQTTGYRDVTPASWAFASYFDGLGMTPEPCVDFIEALVRYEPDDAVVAQAAQGKLLGQLLHFNAAVVIERVEALAKRSLRFRWLLGGVYWSVSGVQDEKLKARIRALADKDGFDRWAASNVGAPVDPTGLTIDNLAVAWIKFQEVSPVDRERLGDLDLFDVPRETPEKGLDLIVAILKIEDNPAMLGILAAGLLEDLVPAHVTPFLDLLVAEAERNPKLRELLRDGVWYNGVDLAVRERLQAAVGP